MPASAAARPVVPPADAVLELRGVGRRFGTGWAVHDVSMRCDGPQAVGLVGANGSGKTTLLRIAAQLLEPSAGSVRLLGRTVPRAGSAASRRHIGFASHEPFAWRMDSVGRNLRYAAALAGLRGAEGDRVVDRAAQQWELHDRMGEPVRELSRGWQQRFACARADLLEPAVLLLDEPTVGLDAAGRELLGCALEAWRRDRVVVVSSHDREWLTSRVDRTVDLDAAGVGAA